MTAGHRSARTAGSEHSPARRPWPVRPRRRSAEWTGLGAQQPRPIPAGQRRRAGRSTRPSRSEPFV